MLAVLRQIVDGGRHEAALDEPVRRARGQHEQPLGAGGARTRLHVAQQDFAFAGALPFGVHDQAGHFGHLLVGEGV
ncbi:hypothetical protein D3C73_1226020 [compost metagenome]